MKKRIAFVLAVVLVLGLCACGGNGEGGKTEKTFDSLHVGVSRQIITADNPIGIHLPGGGDPNRLSETILDDQTLTCIAITDKANNTVLFYSQDLQSVSPDWVREYQRLVAKATGIAAENIYMSATHTHSAAYPKDTTTQQNIEFTIKYEKAIVEAAKAALEDRAPATMYCSEVDVQEANGGQAMAFVRHIKHMDGSVAGANFGTYKQAMMNGFPYEADNVAQLVKFVREGEGKKPVLMMNWGAHATFYGTTALKMYSSDYPAYIRQYIETNTDYVYAHFLSGAGDQTPNIPLYPTANHGLECPDYGAKMGEIIADYTAVDANFTKVEDDVIRKKSQVITVESQKFSEHVADLVPMANDVYQYFLENGQAEGTTYAVSKGFQSCYEARAFVNRANMPETQEIAIEVMSLGSLSLVIAPWELAGHDGAKVIREAVNESGLYDMAFIMAYCNGMYGYIPAKSNYEYNNNRGSYEAYACPYEKGTCEQLAQAYIDLLGELKNS
mgnify:CR=1 FL=1